MDRRSFLGLLGAGAAGFALDPERALWVPGQRKYFFVESFKQRLWFNAGDTVCMPVGATRWGLATPEMMQRGTWVGVYDGTRVRDLGVIMKRIDEGDGALFWTPQALWAWRPNVRVI